MTDILALKRMLTDRALPACEHLLPQGRLIARDWCVGSIQGEAGSSLKVCVSGTKSGRWADFADGGTTSGDMIDLWCMSKNIPVTVALIEIRAWLGVKAPVFEKAEKQWVRPSQPKGSKPKSAVLEYLTTVRKISPSTLEKYRVGENGKTMLFCSFDPDANLIFVKYLGIEPTQAGKKDTRVESGAEPILFGWQAVPDNEREIILTEGEIDALSMWEYGYSALSVPFGGGKGAKQSWIESEYDRLSRFEVIYLALDNDREGDLACEEIVNRIGRHRCRRVVLPLKDANDCLKAGIGREKIDACIRAAQSMDPPELRRAGDFADDVVRIFWPEGGVEVGYRLPFNKLRDKVIFRPGEVTIWTGPSGSGKSQILSHATVGFIDQGARVCIASLEMKASQLIRRMVKQAGNVDRPTEEFIRLIIDWLDTALWVFDHVGKSPVKRLLEVWEYARARYGCDTFIADSLMRLGVGSEDYEGQEKAVFELINWATGNNVHVHLVAHSRKADKFSSGAPETEDIKGASEIGSNAFNIMGVWRNKKLEDELKALEADAQYDLQAKDKLNDLANNAPVVLNVAKQRNADYEGKCGLWFNQNSYQYRSSEDQRTGIQFVSMAHREAAE